MATLAGAKEKLRSKIPNMPANYNRGVAQFLGTSEGTIAGSSPGKSYAAKIKPGMEDYWERKVKQAFGV